MRRRDNIQAEFEAKNEALLSRKVDQEAVSFILSAQAGRKHHALLPACIL